MKEFIDNVKNGTIDPVENTNLVLEKCKKLNKKFNFFNLICEEEAIKQAKDLKKNPKGKLAGVCISVKDCICVKDVESTAGSRALLGYKPPFDATAVERLKKEGAIIIGKTAQDEFGFGGFCVNTGIGYEHPKNPLDSNRSCGGSSGGAAGLAKALDNKFHHIALAESTGGSIACPAAFCGAVGLTPTYGLVSRWGLIDYANSLDKIGSISGTVAQSAMMLDTIAGYDEKDSTSVKKNKKEYISCLNKDIKGMKIGIIKENFSNDVDESVLESVKNAISVFENNGATCEEISLPATFKYGLSSYYLIAMSEASTNLAKYSGMRYGYHKKLDGNFNQYFSDVRSTSFGKEAKRRLLLGTFARMAGFRNAFYIKAMKVRTKIINEYKSAFKKFDALVSPTMPIIAPKLNEIEKLPPLKHYMADICTAPVNLAGLPHISLPCSPDKKSGMPVGMMLMGDHFNEEKLITLSDNFERK